MQGAPSGRKTPLKGEIVIAELDASRGGGKSSILRGKGGREGLIVSKEARLWWFYPGRTNDKKSSTFRTIESESVLEPERKVGEKESDFAAKAKHLLSRRAGLRLG